MVLIIGGKMASGGFRAGSGRPKGSRDLVARTRSCAKKALAKTATSDAGPQQEQTPLGYMLGVMNDPNAEPTRPRSHGCSGGAVCASSDGRWEARQKGSSHRESA
jgi:hypothetical protein